jgi:hypothetical protein
MANPPFITPVSAPFPSPAWLAKHGKKFLAPYYLTVAGVLGAITVVFVVVIALLILVVAQFNVLGLIE